MPHRQPPASAERVADLDRRFQAFALDVVITGTIAIAGAVAAWFLSDHVVWVSASVGLGLATLAWGSQAIVAGLTGATAGKSVRELRLVDVDSGQPIGAGRGLLRDLIRALAGAPTLGMGLAALGWTVVADPARRRRGWHDQICRSIVIDTRPLPVEQADPESGPRHVVNLTAMRLAHAPSAPTVQGGTGSMPRQRAESPSPQVGPPNAAPQPVPPPPASLPSRPMPPGQPMPPQPVPAQPVPAHPRPVPPPTAPERTVVRDPDVLPQPPAAPSAFTPVGPRWRLTFDTGADFFIDGPVLVGRRPEARPGEQIARLLPLPSTDMSLSKTHAMISLAPDGSLIVIDRGSTNGSVLQRRGGERDLPAGKPATLQPGDKVRFGDREMLVRRDGA